LRDIRYLSGLKLRATGDQVMVANVYRIGAAAVVSACFTLASIGPVLAHAQLVSETPAANAVLTSAPTSLTLKFSEAVELKFTGVAITGADKSAVATDAASLDPKDASTFIVPLKGTLASGKYLVQWHALARDGHKTNGSFSFTIAP
jgi:copper resistance protein C